MMGGSGVIDQFLNVFTTYINSGFGLLGGDVKRIPVADLMASTSRSRVSSGRSRRRGRHRTLIKKTLYIGFFASHRQFQRPRQNAFF